MKSVEAAVLGSVARSPDSSSGFHPSAAPRQHCQLQAWKPTPTTQSRLHKAPRASSAQTNRPPGAPSSQCSPGRVS